MKIIKDKAVSPGEHAIIQTPQIVEADVDFRDCWKAIAIDGIKSRRLLSYRCHRTKLHPLRFDGRKLFVYDRLFYLIDVCDSVCV